METEIDYKTIMENNLKKEFSSFPFIKDDEIDNEINNTYNKLNLFSSIIKDNNKIIEYLISDKVNSFELRNKINNLFRNIINFKNKKYLIKEYELINNLLNMLHHKLNQNDIDLMIYEISTINNLYDNTELLSYMQIEDVFYLKIAEQLRLENDNIDTMLQVLDNPYLSINQLVKTAVIFYYHNNYSNNLIDELIEKSLRTYDGSVSIIEHVKDVVKESKAIKQLKKQK